MKTAFARIIAGIAVVIALGAALAFFALPPLVEDACRRQLAALPAALAQDGRLALKQPEVAEVRFSLPARELVLRDFAMHGSVLDVPAPGVAAATAGGLAAGNVPVPVAGVLYTAGEIACTLTWRALLLATPLGRFLLPDSGDGGMVPVADSLRLDEAALALAHREMSLNLHATALRGANVALDEELLGRLLAPAPAAGQPGASGDILYPLAATSLTATAVDLSADFPGSDQSASLTMNSGGITGLDGRRAASAQVDSVACTLDGEPRLRVASLTLEDITLPDRERVLALARARASGDEAALLRTFEAALAGPEPLVRKAGLSGLELALDEALQAGGAGRTAVGASALMLDTASLDWRSSTPPDHTLTVKGLSLPLALLEEESGLSFPGLNAFVLDASLSRSVEPGGETGKSAGKNAARHQGAIAARGLCGVDYAFRLTSGGQDFPQDMLRGTYSEASLTYTDQGFLAYLASGVMPTAQAAMMAIKVGLGRFCAKNTPENATLRDALETFAERPGTVNIRARAPFTPMQALFIAGDGDAGALFSATAAPGPESLEQAMNRVRAGRAPDTAAPAQGRGPSAGGQR